ncbi:pyridoxamine 5'-phosphate oxidase family protein [Amycolatopsis panacis]|uniref:Pyridoxamine 5'-phosphate oxidase family protein n=1 Tax=Amycolatopsis panacis TaxID=2340917 RepID=A0A419I1I2_9PSEU|nr:pyridoxamine 5'-phosphate oxidase family protein [Amycolatopsis panacis]RJQ83570.1 pyridoxamine 5'-phosphate oxidase family protein [Amycolatopsis panacis]
MTSWLEFSTAVPSLAERVKARFSAAESHVLATLRRDGAPRVSGSEIAFRGDEAYVGSMLDARKARDLLRDGRFALHAAPAIEEGGDAKIAGRAVAITDLAEITRIQGPEPTHLFRLEIEEAVLTWVEGNTLLIESWHPGRWVRFARPDNGPVVPTVLG